MTTWQDDDQWSLSVLVYVESIIWERNVHCNFHQPFEWRSSLMWLDYCYTAILRIRAYYIATCHHRARKEGRDCLSRFVWQSTSRKLGCPLPPESQLDKVMMVLWGDPGSLRSTRKVHESRDHGTDTEHAIQKTELASHRFWNSTNVCNSRISPFRAGSIIRTLLIRNWN